MGTNEPGQPAAKSRSLPGLKIGRSQPFWPTQLAAGGNGTRPIVRGPGHPGIDWPFLSRNLEALDLDFRFHSHPHDIHYTAGIFSSGPGGGGRTARAGSEDRLLR